MLKLELQWFKPGFCCHILSLHRKLYFVLSLFTQVYKCFIYFSIILLLLYFFIKFLLGINKWVPVIIMRQGNIEMDSHLIHEGVAIFPVANSCYRNQVRCQPDGPLGS